MSAEHEYMRADHRLRSLLFGSGETTSGHVKGEDARLQVAECLFEMKLRKLLKGVDAPLAKTLRKDLKTV